MVIILFLLKDLIKLMLYEIFGLGWFIYFKLNLKLLLCILFVLCIGLLVLLEEIGIGMVSKIFFVFFI